MKNSRFNVTLVVIHIICLFILSYTLIIKNMFSSTDSVNEHLKQAHVYTNASNMVKAKISENLNQRFEDKLVQRAIAERLLDAIVTPDFVEKQSQRVLPVAAKIMDKPLDIKNNKVVVDTKERKEKVTSELQNNSDKVPDLIKPAVTNLVEAVPDQLTLVDMEKRPNSLLGYLTKAKILFEQITLWNNAAIAAGILTALLLIIINREQLRVLFKYLAIAYLVSGAIVLVGSYLFPYVLMLFNSGPNIYLNQLIHDAAYYLFAQTRTPSIIYLVAGGIFYLIFRWAYIDTVQTNVDKALHKSSSKKKKGTQ